MRYHRLVPLVNLILTGIPPLAFHFNSNVDLVHLFLLKDYLAKGRTPLSQDYLQRLLRRLFYVFPISYFLAISSLLFTASMGITMHQHYDFYYESKIYLTVRCKYYLRLFFRPLNKIKSLFY